MEESGRYRSKARQVGANVARLCVCFPGTHSFSSGIGNGFIFHYNLRMYCFDAAHHAAPCTTIAPDNRRPVDQAVETKTTGLLLS